MHVSRRLFLALSLPALLAACGGGRDREEARGPQGPVEINRLITKYARIHDIPERLIHETVQRESGYNPAARNGPYYGLMQIHPQTARTMGYRGDPAGLLDAETNLIYAGKYLRGAWLVSRGNYDRAHMWYRKGYYYEAKRMGLLEETGLRS
ncbi:lytic transglycosylase domain-containing protein [Rhodobacteraceae bacterium HSP-20]|uniref:Lytic transglycosylase domain-containing protein n=1 Tax=Paragemmobacter amnigenus TaxID=2852097 RepID=A0ABS6J4S3_9RHOB|nr:lytic transglycosylase domain-containing protein [Rhodobacter amnigenus]MBU9698497.1 lytic transglycosylase domain-containing protein [Rhodobacter amnigenus]MBV4389724.1 lytic transglycosylase domain-containing protein [Rhodobacter amnigenus]